MKEKPAAQPAPAKAAPTHIVLLAPANEWSAGTVLPATPEILDVLAASAAEFREATPQERGIAGFSS
jgi:hypothetical protein